MTNSGRCCSAFAPIPWRCWKPYRLIKPSSDPGPREFSSRSRRRRILDRLRPLYIQELGLERSIQTLLRNANAQAPDLALTSQIDGKLNAIDGLLSQTVYRVIQEAVTNVLRHARADSMHVRAAIEDRELVVEISDNGIGFPADRLLGRGLTGMLERVRALSGTLQLLREEGRTCVRCRLPAGDSAAAVETREA
jgi:two-component system, NarL family, sensor histidine kinase UhpB